jgi:hypothetical protein
MSDNNDLSIATIFWTGSIGVLVVFAIILALVLFYLIALNQQEVVKNFDQPNSEYAALVDSQEKQLTRYGWTQADPRQLIIPISRAMEIELKRMAERQQAAGMLPAGSASPSREEKP